MNYDQTASFRDIASEKEIRDEPGILQIREGIFAEHYVVAVFEVSSDKILRIIKDVSLEELRKTSQIVDNLGHIDRDKRYSMVEISGGLVFPDYLLDEKLSWYHKLPALTCSNPEIFDWYCDRAMKAMSKIGYGQKLNMP